MNNETKSANSWSVVVLGDMNPAIHHPHWYHAVDLISTEELDRAMSLSGATLVMPQLSQFQFDTLQVQCMPNRWQVKTSDREEHNRMIDLAAGTFRRLGDTPVRSFGINCHFDVDTDVADVRAALDRGLQGSPLAFRFKEAVPSLEQATLAYPLPNLEVEGQPHLSRSLKVTARPSARSKSALRLDINGDNQVETGGTFKHFDLDVLIRASRDELTLGDSFLERFVTTLKQHGA